MLPLTDIIRLYFVAFCVVTAVHKFYVRLIISQTRFLTGSICPPPGRAVVASVKELVKEVTLTSALHKTDKNYITIVLYCRCAVTGESCISCRQSGDGVDRARKEEETYASLRQANNSEPAGLSFSLFRSLLTLFI